MTEFAHVLILGCGRSGTSIFGELFDQLPPYTYFSEPSFSTCLSGSFETPIAVKVPRNSADYPPPPGLSIPIEPLLTKIPGRLQIYWQVRHPLDAICSLRVGISRNWGHHPRPLDWEDWLDRPLIEQCAHHWTYLNTIGFEHVAHLASLCRFEEMIADPLTFATNIYQEVGGNPADHQAEIQAWANRVQNTNNQQFVEAITSRPYSTTDHQVRVDRWKENLSEEELEQVLAIIEEAAHRMGYALP